MSYCVNCGVELAPSEKVCPLCGVEVLNPRDPWKEPERRPYSERLELLSRRVDRHYFASLTTVLLLIPLFLTLIIDLIAGDGLSWSICVAGALGLIYVWGVLPWWSKKYSVWHVVAGCAAVLPFLLLIEFLSGGDWFWQLGLPLGATAGAFTVGMAILFTRKRNSTLLTRTAIFLMCAGLFCVCVEFIIKHYRDAAFSLPVWSLYVLVPCMLLSLVASILERRKHWKEEVRKRLFF